MNRNRILYQNTIIEIKLQEAKMFSEKTFKDGPQYSVS